MKKLYLALSLVLFSSLLATVLAVLAYNKSGTGSSNDVDKLAAQVDELVIRTNELQSNMASSISIDTSTATPQSTATEMANEPAKTVAEEPKAEPMKTETPAAKEPAKTPEAEKSVSSKVVTGNSVNMRSEPKVSASLVTTLNKGVEVASDGQTSRDSGVTFVKISYNGRTGWVSQDYLK